MPCRLEKSGLKEISFPTRIVHFLTTTSLSSSTGKGKGKLTIHTATTNFRQSGPIEVGDLLYLYSDRNKTHAKDRYLVVSTDSAFCNVREFIGSQLRSTSYCVKKTYIYSVPTEVPESTPSQPPSWRDEDNSLSKGDNIPPLPPRILGALAMPADIVIPPPRTQLPHSIPTYSGHPTRPSQEDGTFPEDKEQIMEPSISSDKEEPLASTSATPSHADPCTPAGPRQSSWIM